MTEKTSPPSAEKAPPDHRRARPMEELDAKETTFMLQQLRLLLRASEQQSRQGPRNGSATGLRGYYLIDAAKVAEILGGVP